MPIVHLARAVLVASLAVPALVAWLAIASTATAEPLAWDADQVKELALRLQLELEATEAAAAVAPKQPTVVQQRERDAAASNLPQVRDASDTLVNRLEAGAGREETAALYRRVRDGLAQIAADAEGVAPRAGTRNRFQKVNATLDELGRYYGD